MRRQRKRHSLSVSHSLSNSSTHELPQNWSWPRPSTPSLHSEINIQCVLSLESTQRKQRSKLFYRAHQSWVRARIFLFQGTDQLLWLKTKLLYNETREKERRKKQSGLLRGWMKAKCEWMLKYNNIWPVFRSFDWNAKPFFFSFSVTNNVQNNSYSDNSEK